MREEPQGPSTRPLGLRRINRLPKHCVWEVTNACNLNCVHCESASGKPRPEELSTAEALQLCEDLATLGCEEVNLSGGEPFLRRDWAQICTRLVALGMEPIIVSNLTLLDAPLLDQLAAAGVRSMATSLDGPQVVHDRIRRNPGADFSPFERVTAGMRALKERGFFLSVVTHISLWNMDFLDETVHILEELGVDLWQVQIGFPEGRLAEIADEYLIYPGQMRDISAFIKRTKARGKIRVDTADNIGFYGKDEPIIRERGGKKRFWAGCLAGYRVLSISADGSIRGCPSLAIPVGNLRDEPLADIWNDEKRFWFNTCWDENKLEGRCRACPYRRVCRGGCKSMALATTGSIYRNIYCLNQIDKLKGDPRRREEHGRILP